MTLHAPGALHPNLLGASGEVRVGALETGARWEYSLNGGETWLAGRGSALTPEGLGGDGGKALQVVQISASGVRSLPKDLVFLLDTEVSAPLTQLAQDTGIEGDRITHDPTLTITGLEPAAIWDFRIDGGEWRRGEGSRVEGRAFDGTADGAHRVDIRQTDAAGNQAESALEFVLDRTAPAPAVVALANDTGLSGDRITQDGTLAVSGVAADATWSYRIDGGDWVAGGSGGEIADAALNVEGAHRVEVRVSDVAGNQAQSALEFVLDRTAPAPAVVELVNDTGLRGDRITQDGTLAVSGVAADATWSYRIDGGDWVSGGSSGKIVDAALNVEGAHRVEVRVSDVAGNQAESALEFVLDRTAPAPAVVALVNDTGLRGDRITRDGTLAVSGVAADATWSYRIDGGGWVAGGNGGEIVDAALNVEGAHRVEVRVTDLAGNQAESALEFVLDRTAPAPAVVELVNDTGLRGDRITRDGTLAVSGVAADATWSYRIDGGDWVAGGSNGEIVDAALNVEGAHRVEVRVSDVAGNSADTAIDLHVARSAAAPELALTRDTGVSATDRVTSDARIGVSGLAAGASWKYSLDGVHWIDGTGNGIAASAFGSDGLKTVRVQQTDGAGNVSPLAQLDFTLDTSSPLPTVTLASPARDRFAALRGDGTNFYESSRVSADTVLQWGLEDGASWRYRIDGEAGDHAGVGRNLSLSGLSEGQHEVRIRQQDVAGNWSAETAVQVTVDRTAPMVTGLWMLKNQDMAFGWTFRSNEDVQIALVPVGTMNDGTAQSYLANATASKSLIVLAGTDRGAWFDGANDIYMALAIDTAGNAAFVSLSGSGPSNGLVAHALETRYFASPPDMNLVTSQLDPVRHNWTAFATVDKTDHLFGSANADHFVFSSMSTSSKIDWIHGYDKQQGDVIEITDSAFTTLDTSQAASLARYFRKEVLADGTISLWIDKDGLGQTYPDNSAGGYDHRILVSAAQGTELQILLATGGTFVI
ncbi:hypothetical protein CDN99_09355 [Roseateles aquatilis]|uniref:Bacterial Ig-like domain-containing protein n=1 Tax=Roseateles aquatilis TaxID=431061 RepID=A0A246JFB1_9BURK|nr:hypothetical protein CDN99_09355 [Roseateles aquatilis]